jgi:hypothetical protein
MATTFWSHINHAKLGREPGWVHRVAPLLFASAVLSSCGGGGDSPPPPPASVPLSQAVKNLQTNGLQKTLAVSGTVSNGTQTVNVVGTLLWSVSGFKTSTTFEGQSALSSTETLNGTLTGNGQTIPLASTQQSFVTASYAPLGYSAPSSYCVATSTTPLPVAASVGTTGTYAIYTCYSDSTKATQTGTQTISYNVSAGTTSTNLTATLIVSV